MKNRTTILLIFVSILIIIFSFFFLYKPQLLQASLLLPLSTTSTNSPITINPYENNPNFQTFQVWIDNGLNVKFKDYGAKYSVYFNMKNGNNYTWADIPSTIQKKFWKECNEGRCKYGVDFSNVSNTIKNNLNYVVLQRVSSYNILPEEISIEGNTLNIKNELFISHDDILSTYSIPKINKDEVWIGNLNNSWKECIEVNPETLDCISEITRTNWVPNGATWNITFDPSITISESEVITTSILVNVTAETNFTHLTMDTAEYSSPPYDDLLAYYPFDGDKENTPIFFNFTIYDFSQNNRDGMARVGTYVNSTNCIYGDCVKFDGMATFGNRSYIDLTNKWTFSGNISGNISMTIMMWARPQASQASTSDARMIQSGTECVLRYAGGRAEFILNSFTTNDRTISPTSTFPANNWTHVVGMYNQATNNMSIWINGVETNSTNPTGIYGTCATWTLGGASGTGAGYYNGSIDEVMVFNDAITSAQILAIYNNQSARFLGSGTQTIQPYHITNITTWNNLGDNRVNVTSNFETIQNDNISLRLGQINFSVSPNNLSAYYPFETLAKDAMNNFNGIELGSIYYNSTGGLNQTGAYKFDGVNDAIDINDLDVNNNFSISAWAYPKSNVTGYIVGKYDLNYSYGFYFADGQFALFGSSDGGTDNMDWVLTGIYDFNQWYHVVGMFNGSKFSIYVNGNLVSGASQGTPITSIFNDATDTLIGAARNGAGVTGVFNGTIDNVAIFNRTLSQAEIQAIYNQGGGVQYTSFQNLTLGDMAYNISRETDFLFLDYNFLASSNSFLSPLLIGNISFTTWYVAEEEEEEIAISISRIDTATEVNVTQNLFFNTTLNITCLTGSCGTINVSLHYNNLEGWNISSAGFIQNKTIAEPNPTGIYLRVDGLRGYIIGLTSDKVIEYDLSIAWNTSTISNTRNFSTATQDTNAQGIFFKPDGLKMYILGGDGDDVNEYNLTNAWNVSSTIYNQLFSVATQDVSPTGIFFKPDGLKMYVIGLADNVSEYTLSSAWNVGSATFSKGFSFATEEDFSTEVFFRSDGKKMYISGNERDEIHEYNLSTAWDVSTADYLRLYDATAEETNPNGIFFNSYGTKFYIVGVKSGIIQYSLPAIEERGLISTTAGTIPFYTNSTNPLTTNSLSSGQSELITFWVNATGLIDSTHDFFAFANVTTNLSISNQTSHWNVTIREGEEGDTCTYTSGNWNVDCSDNCVIISNVNLAGNNISFINSGTFTLRANVTRIAKWIISSGCKIAINSGYKFG